MADLIVTLFGPLEARIGDQSPPVQFSAQRTKSLLGYLLLHRDTCHPRDRLATLWWGDRETQKARHSLNTELWRLRRVLEHEPNRPASFLIVATSEIGFNTRSSYWLDVEEFEQLCAFARQVEASDGDAAGRALQRAVSLYRDDLLPDCYEEWCFIERQRLQQLYLFALSRLAAFHARRNEFTDSIDCCQRILDHDPLREEIHRDLMRYYLATARPQAALQQFRACASILKRELGLAPMAETLALAKPFLAQGKPPSAYDPDPAEPPSSNAINRGDVQEILTQLSAAAATLALAGTQIQQALYRLKQFAAVTHDEQTGKKAL